MPPDVAAPPAAPSPAPSPRLPPGPPARRGGVVESARYYWNFANDPIGFVAKRFATYGDVYYAPSRDGGLYVVRHPDHLRDVLVTHASKYRKEHTAMKQLQQVLGDGLLTSDGATWTRHRRMIQPAFGKKKLAAYADAMRDECVAATSRWRDGEARDVGADMTALTLGIVCRTLFSHDVSRDTADVAHAMAAFQTSVLQMNVVPAWLPSPWRMRAERAVATLDRIMYDLIAARRREVASGAPARDDLLTALVTAVDEEGDGRGLTEREVRDELVTLFLAGHETTAQALTWTLYLLAKNPRVERALHDELDGVLGRRAPGYDDLARLPYTEQVIKESMRIYPPAYMVARRAHEDAEIGGYVVPRGSEVVCWIYHAHHDARWFPEPEAFRPERFAPEEEAKLPRTAYAPFGAGPRACVGRAFAMIEAQLALATLAQRFRFELPRGAEVRPRMRVTLVPDRRVTMTLRARGS